MTSFIIFWRPAQFWNCQRSDNSPYLETFTWVRLVMLVELFMGFLYGKRAQPQYLLLWEAWNFVAVPNRHLWKPDCKTYCAYWLRVLRAKNESPIFDLGDHISETNYQMCIIQVLFWRGMYVLQLIFGFKSVTPKIKRYKAVHLKMFQNFTIFLAFCDVWEKGTTGLTKPGHECVEYKIPKRMNDTENVGP